eukprot:6179364-Pleurochrysis_carterae.AAC.1
MSCGGKAACQWRRLRIHDCRLDKVWHGVRRVRGRGRSAVAVKNSGENETAHAGVATLAQLERAQHGAVLLGSSRRAALEPSLLYALL